jgi:hypothetical protein
LFTDYTKAQTTLISSPYQSVVSLTNNNAQAVSSGITCVDLSYDLYQGLSDSFADKSVSNLQNYLSKLGYIKVSPNGYFGPSTLSAVKNYQLNNNISNTGRVGPATRKKIRDDSCKINNNSALVLNSVSNQANNNSVVGINKNNPTVISPAADSVLATDSKTSIRWKEIKGSIYGITLEDKDGLGVGHIASAVSGNSFEWTVGKVFSASTNSNIYVEPGMYRIKLTNSSYSSNIPDQYSGLFSITGKYLNIGSIIPSSVSNSDNVSIVAYGRGFDSNTMVSYGIDGNNRMTKPVFVSNNGKLLVFEIPSGISVGDYSVNVYSLYSSGATSTPSNSVLLKVNN